MLIEDVGSILQGAGHGTLSVDLFKYQLPDEPDACIAIREYAGAEPTFVHSRRLPTTVHPRFQLVARATTAPAAMTAATNAWMTLSSIRNEVINGTFYQSIMPIQAVFIVERDENDRWIAGANFEVTKEV